MHQIKTTFAKDLHNAHVNVGTVIHEALIPTEREATSKFVSLCQSMTMNYPYKTRSYDSRKISDQRYEIWSNLSKAPVVIIELEKMSDDMVSEYEQFLDDEEERKFMEREAALDKAFRRRNELSDQPECLVEADKRNSESKDEE